MDSALDKIKKLSVINKVKKYYVYNSLIVERGNCPLSINTLYDKRLYNNIDDFVELGELSIHRKIYQNVVDKIAVTHNQLRSKKYNKCLFNPFSEIINESYKKFYPYIGCKEYDIKSICFITTYNFMCKIEKESDSTGFFDKVKQFDSKIVLLPDDEHSIYHTVYHDAIGLIFTRDSDCCYPPVVLEIKTNEKQSKKDIPIEKIIHDKKDDDFQKEIEMRLEANITINNKLDFWLIGG